MKGKYAVRVGDRMLFFVALAAFVLILLYPRATADGVRDGLNLSYRAVIPSVFPSLIVTGLLFSGSCQAIERTVGRLVPCLFGVSSRGAVAWVAGLLSGFPVGAVTVLNDVRDERISREEGEYLAAFVNNTGPAFLVGGIGLGLCGSARLGWTLYLLQIPTSLAVGLLLRPRQPLSRVREKEVLRARLDPVSAVVRASETCLRIVGFVCCFSALSSLLSILIREGLSLAILGAFLEVGNGAVQASRLAFPFPALPLLSFAVCFSGLSVHFQTLAVLKDAGLSASLYWKGKIVSGLFGLLFSLLLCLTN